MKNQCVWIVDEDRTWEGSCKNLFQFTDSGPKENGFRFCPYCGKPLKTLASRRKELSND